MRVVPAEEVVEVLAADANADADADELASNELVVVAGRSRHMTMESRPLEAATARLPRFTASSA